VADEDVLGEAILNRNAVPNATVPFRGKPPGGGSHPRFYAFDDQVIRIVKWHPSPHGQKACYNELVASRLGQLIGAPILRGCVVFVPDDVIPADHRAIGAREGFHFAVTRMDGEDFVPAKHYAEITNMAILPSAAVQLAWLHVQDQVGHNQFMENAVDPAAGHLLKLFRLVDMGAMLGSWNWTAITLV
jgi:hypothetical protein